MRGIANIDLDAVGQAGVLENFARRFSVVGVVLCSVRHSLVSRNYLRCGKALPEHRVGQTPMQLSLPPGANLRAVRSAL